jgi:hypothetical protein
MQCSGSGSESARGAGYKMCGLSLIIFRYRTVRYIILTTESGSVADCREGYDHNQLLVLNLFNHKRKKTSYFSWTVRTVSVRYHDWLYFTSSNVKKRFLMKNILYVNFYSPSLIALTTSSSSLGRASFTACTHSLQSFLVMLTISENRTLV